jgi:hypothetical protein
MIVKRQTHQPNLPYFYFWRFIMKNATKITVASAILAALASGAAHSALDIRDFQPGFRGEIIRGPLPPLFFAPAKVAKCPNGASSTFRSELLACAVPTAHFANVTCSNPTFPRYVALARGNNPAETDLCTTRTPLGLEINSETTIGARIPGAATCDAGDTKLNHSTAGQICLNRGVSINAGSNINSFSRAPANNHNAGDYYIATVGPEVFKFKDGVDYEYAPVNGFRNGKSYVRGVADGEVVSQRWRLDSTQPGATDKYKRIVQRAVSPLLVEAP